MSSSTYNGVAQAATGDMVEHGAQQQPESLPNTSNNAFIDILLNDKSTPEGRGASLPLKVGSIPISGV